MKLEKKPKFRFKLKADRRRKLEDPLPVELEAVADLHLNIPASGREGLDELYVGILLFAPLPGRHLAYRSETFCLHFDLPPDAPRTDYRPIRVIVPSLVAVEHQLVEVERDFTRQKGLLPGHEILVMQDSDGNWVEIRERHEIG